MRLYSQIYDNDNYNKFYGMEGVDYSLLPSGYGAMPYANSFVRNKLNPTPWGGTKIPSIYSAYASAGFSYIQDTLNTDIYKQYPTFNMLTSAIFDNAFASIPVNPYTFGPVNTAYIVSVSGIVNHTNATNPSGCKSCDYLNQDYKVWIPNIGGTNDAGFNTSISWVPYSYPCKKDEYPQGRTCNSLSNIPNLSLISAHKAPMTGIQYAGSTGNILLAFSLSVNKGPEDGTNITTYGAYSPIMFIKDFGEFDLYKRPSFNYQNKPNMLDDTGYVLPPSTGTTWYSKSSPAGKILNTYVNYNGSDSCDYSNATCIVRPYKTHNLYSPKEALYSLVDKKLDTIQYDAASDRWNNFFKDKYRPLSFSLNEIKTVTTNTSDIYCSDCSGYYSQQRSLINVNIYGDTGYSSSFSNIYTSGFNNEIFGTSNLYTSGTVIDRFVWYGTGYSVFGDNFYSQSQFKSFLPNLTNICEFGCDEINTNLTSNSVRNRYCNNHMAMDLVTSNYTTLSSSGTINGFKGFLDAYLYLGQTIGNTRAGSSAIFSPYRWKKRICNDLTNTPYPCSDYHGNNFGSPVVSGKLDMSLPLFSGGWSYEQWSSRNYEFNSTAVNTIVDVSGLCNFTGTDIIMDIDRTSNKKCRGQSSCLICNDTTYPTTVTIDFNNNTDTYILDDNLIHPNFNGGALEYNVTDSCSWIFNGGRYYTSRYPYTYPEQTGNCFYVGFFVGTICNPRCPPCVSSGPGFYLNGLTYISGNPYLHLDAGPFTSGNCNLLNGFYNHCDNFNFEIPGPSYNTIDDNWYIDQYIPLQKYFANDCSTKIYASGQLALTCYNTAIPSSWSAGHVNLTIGIEFGDFIDGRSFL